MTDDLSLLVGLLADPGIFNYAFDEDGSASIEWRDSKSGNFEVRSVSSRVLSRFLFAQQGIITVPILDGSVRAVVAPWHPRLDAVLRSLMDPVNTNPDVIDRPAWKAIIERFDLHGMPEPPFVIGGRV